MKRKFGLTPYQVISLVAFTSYGISSLIPSTYALQTGQQTVETVATAAFVFPSTIQSLVKQVNDAAHQASSAESGAATALQACKEAADSKGASTFATKAKSGAASAAGAAQAADGILSQLAGYATRSQSDLDAAKTKLAHLQQEDAFLKTALSDQIASAEKSLHSCERVNLYVQEGYQKAKSFADQAHQAAISAATDAKEAATIVQQKMAAEKETADQTDTNQATPNPIATVKTTTDKRKGVPIKKLPTDQVLQTR